MLNMQQLTAGIKALAKFHAFFWNGGVYNKYLSDGDVSEVAACVWDVATHWAPIRQPADMMQQVLTHYNGILYHTLLSRMMQQVHVNSVNTTDMGSLYAGILLSSSYISLPVRYNTHIQHFRVLYITY